MYTCHGPCVEVGGQLCVTVLSICLYTSSRDQTQVTSLLLQCTHPYLLSQLVSPQTPISDNDDDDNDDDGYNNNNTVYSLQCEPPAVESLRVGCVWTLWGFSLTGK